MKRELKELATTDPDLPALKEGYLDAVQRRDRTVFSRQRLNYRARFTVWGNQSDDGKKWTAPAGQKPFPWSGASDARVSLVDKYINEDVAFLMVVSDRMRVMVSGTESNDAAYAHRLTNLLRWMNATQITEYRFRSSRLRTGTPPPAHRKPRRGRDGFRRPEPVLHRHALLHPLVLG